MWIRELRYQDPRTKTYLGSPSLVRLDDGAILASHDYFGSGSPKNMEGRAHLTSIYRSEDDGVTWTNITHVSGAFWNSLFTVGSTVYLLGPSAQFGHIVIRRSDDGGYSWTHPADETTGLLARGGPDDTPPNYHCAPVPVVFHNGRIYRALEDKIARIHGRDFQAFVISVDEDADLLKAENWTMSNKLDYDLDADPPHWGSPDRPTCWIEGNVVADPDGQLWDILRLRTEPQYNTAAMVKILDDGKRLEFDPATGFINLPGGETKFTIRRDPETGIYWSLVNDMQDEPYIVRRNRLSVVTSDDLKTWTHRKVLLEDNLESDPDLSYKKTGFQYVDWVFDGDDIMYLSRTAYDGAHNFHDSNRITFSRIREYRKLIP